MSVVDVVSFLPQSVIAGGSTTNVKAGGVPVCEERLNLYPNISTDFMLDEVATSPTGNHISPHFF